MTNKTLSKNAWIIFSLSLSAILIIPILGILTSVARQIFDPESVNPSRTIFSEAGFMSCLLSLTFAFFALYKGINALKSKDKSLPVWLGIVLSIIAIIFWGFLIISELLYPH